MAEKFEKLCEEIVNRSVASTWQDARSEWSMIYVTREEGGGASCLCGNTPIKELCIIENHMNGNIAVVGNVCINQFLGFRTDLIIDAIDRIKKDDTKTISADALAFLEMHDVLNAAEHKFTVDKMNTSGLHLTDKQIAFRKSVNRKILRWFDKRRAELQERKRAKSRS